MMISAGRGEERNMAKKVRTQEAVGTPISVLWFYSQKDGRFHPVLILELLKNVLVEYFTFLFCL